MLSVTQQVMIASNAREAMSEGEDKALTLEEVSYLATLGGGKVLCLEDKIGSFELGKEFDGVWVRTTTRLDSAMTPGEEHSAPQKWQVNWRRAFKLCENSRKALSLFWAFMLRHD